jgi:cellulose synthase/poly-beta-1,6-N-acetylglucosamine synthase-like glycosyltransferase
VEDSIGWDFGPTKVEDSAFGLEFAKQFGRRSYFLNSRVKGSSPQSLKDLIRQRRRWYSGIISLAFSRRNRNLARIPLMIYALITMFSPMQYILVVFLISLIISTPAFPVSFLFLPLWGINFSYQLWLYEEGYNINRESSSGKWVGRSWMRFLIMPLIYVSGSIEATAVALGFIDYLKKDNSFQVIEKPI